MTLVEIIEMFKLFGFHEKHLRAAMAGGNSAFNAFEGLKLTLQIRWGEMCQELSVTKQKELRPTYDRLMKITMKSRTTKADQAEQEQVNKARGYQKLKMRMAAQSESRKRDFFGMVRDKVKDRVGEMTPEAKANARAMGFLDEED